MYTKFIIKYAVLLALFLIFLLFPVIQFVLGAIDFFLRMTREIDAKFGAKFELWRVL